MTTLLSKRLGIFVGLFLLAQFSLPAAAVSAFTQIPASGYTTQSGIQLEASSEGGQNVAYIDNSD